MKIFSFFNDNEELSREFVEFPFELYRGDKKYIAPFRSTTRSEMSPDENPYFEYGKARFFIAVEKDQVLGRCAAFRNPKMDLNGKRVGTIGYFECIPDYLVAKELLSEAIKWLHVLGVEEIFGPMNFSIWNKYRFRTTGFDRMPFYSENYNKRYYPLFFERYGFRPCKSWLSKEIDLSSKEDWKLLELRNKAYKERYDNALQMGYEVGLSEARNIDRDLRDIHRIATVSFAGHYRFYPINFCEFNYLFGGLRKIVKDGQIIQVRKNKAMVGFLLLCHDYGKSIGAMRGDTNLFAKMKFLMNKREDTIVKLFSAALPEHLKNRSRLGAVLMHISIEEFYKNRRIKHVIHSTMHEDNRSTLYSQDIGEEIGRYVLYKL